MTGTVRDLSRRLVALMALTVVATTAMFAAYVGVHGDAVPLKSTSAPGVLAVGTAKRALLRAQDDAEKYASSDAGGNGDFAGRIAVAYQSLAQAAADNVTGLSGRQALKTVVGLITSYTGWVDAAAHEPGATPLHQAYLHYAASVLGPKDPPQDDLSSVLGRLADLQRRQLRVVHAQTHFGPLLVTGWTLAVALYGMLLWALWDAHRFLRARFRRRWNRQLLAAGGLLLAEAVVLGLFTWWTHQGMFHTRAGLDRVDSSSDLSQVGADVAGYLSGAGYRAAAAGGIFGGGVIVAGLVFWALWPRITEYRVRTPR